MLKKTILLSAGIPAITCCLFSQSLPDQWSIDEVNHRLTIGGKWDTDVYQTDMVHEMQIEFSQSNWWTLLTNNYNSGTDLSGTLTIDGTTYEQVGIRFKGQTSYMMTIGEEKKSFNISMDSFIDGQDHDGFTVFNLNNCFEDPSFMKEFLYLYHIRTHVPAARASYVHLTINGENWGVYPCVEGMNGPYIKDWFLSNDGTRWRADAPNGGFGGGGGGGPQWGDGTAAVNWLGSDQSEYEQYYTLKSSTVADPWANLIETCDVLNNTPNAELVNELPAVLDIDRTLWFLACENAFGDDDSYIFKGKMDYYLYWEIETGRMTPLEYDGNSILVNESMSWGPFYHATDADYPLLYELLAIPEWRQRYLAHLRTILETSMDADLNAALIEQHSNMITDFVEADDKKLYSFSQFNSGVSGLEEDIQTRKGTIMSNSEVNTTGATISDVVMSTTGGEWANPQANETVNIIVSVASPDGINSVWLYFAEGLVGNFTRVTMADDGTLGDGAAGDGVYGAQIPGMQEGALVRFYVEARENNAALTATYMPEGAEHDVFYYIVTAPYAAETDVVINEIMAINATGFLVDETGSDEDWIELYNKSNAAVDLTGFALTDNLLNTGKWYIPDGTVLSADDYLIIWADEDSTDGAFHANFRLDGDGESLHFINAEGEISDELVFGEQEENLGLARIPNGTGPFVIQGQTFGSNNEYVGIDESSVSVEVSAYPVPASVRIHFVAHRAIAQIILADMNGREVLRTNNSHVIEVGNLSEGIYVARVKLNDGTASNIRVVVRH